MRDPLAATRLCVHPARHAFISKCLEHTGLRVSSSCIRCVALLAVSKHASVESSVSVRLLSLCRKCPPLPWWLGARPRVFTAAARLAAVRPPGGQHPGAPRCYATTWKRRGDSGSWPRSISFHHVFLLPCQAFFFGAASKPSPRMPCCFMLKACKIGQFVKCKRLCWHRCILVGLTLEY